MDEVDENHAQGEVASGSGGPEAVPTEGAPNPEGSVPSKGKDERGEGDVVDGRQLRKYKRVDQTTGDFTELWSISTHKQKRRQSRSTNRAYRPPNTNPSYG